MQLEPLAPPCHFHTLACLQDHDVAADWMTCACKHTICHRTPLATLNGCRALCRYIMLDQACITLLSASPTERDDTLSHAEGVATGWQRHAM